MPHLLHFSEDPDIKVFRPHIPASSPNNPPLVWAVDEEHAWTYLFPRDCPRILLWKVAATTDSDWRRWAGANETGKVACIEHRWFEHLRMRLVQSAFITWGLEAGSAAAVDAVDVSGANSGIKLGATSRIANCHVDSPGATGPTLGIQLGDHSSLTRCTTVGFQTGLLSGDGADIRDCNVQAAVNFGVDLAGYTTMTGCTVTANLVAAVITDGPENVLTNNRIETQAPATCVAMENTVGGQYRDNQLFNCGTIFAAIGSYTRMVGNLLASSGINTFDPAATHLDLGNTVPASTSSSPWINPYGP